MFLCISVTTSVSLIGVPSHQMCATWGKLIYVECETAVAEEWFTYSSLRAFQETLPSMAGLHLNRNAGHQNEREEIPISVQKSLDQTTLPPKLILLGSPTLSIGRARTISSHMTCKYQAGNQHKLLREMNMV